MKDRYGNIVGMLFLVALILYWLLSAGPLNEELYSLGVRSYFSYITKEVLGYAVVIGGTPSMAVLLYLLFRHSRNEER